MSNILVLKSSILGDNSQSNQLIDQAIQDQENVTIRDLAAQPVPALDVNVLTALNASEGFLTDEQKSIIKLSDELVKELKTADCLIVGAPMYNFMVPTQLKNWFDLLARAGVTFNYTESGPVGLIEDKKVIVVTTRGGLHRDSERNSIESYITTIFGFMGINGVKYVYAEGLNLNEDVANEARSYAQENLNKSI